MSIFTVIKNIFKKFNPSVEKTDECFANTLTFKVYDDGFYDLSLDIHNNSSQDAKNLAKLLFDLNSGKLYDLFIVSMTNEGMKGKNSTMMIEVMSKWQTLFNEKNKSKNNSPLIKPSQTFSVNHIK